MEPRAQVKVSILCFQSRRVPEEQLLGRRHWRSGTRTWRSLAMEASLLRPLIYILGAIGFSSNPWPKIPSVPFPFGDVNGDGKDDVVTSEFAKGVFAVVFGSEAKHCHINVEEMDSTNGFIITGGSPQVLGDFNGDKTDDILVVGTQYI
eukprot:gb/GECG01009254.1/.p1 GENE.gb/GECG01009254.1/~~gb/GECG01009254.1/.p1  ORF type:complete len:149 (+),score=18.88 gb/GECG01009254.1/:1-447(+)